MNISLSIRSRFIIEKNFKNGPVIYWMTREFRTNNNWALVEAQKLAEQLNSYLIVLNVFRSNLIDYCGTKRLVDFLFGGLTETNEELQNLNIPYVINIGDPIIEIPEFVKKINASCLVIDQNPLKINKIWKKSLVKSLDIPIIETDSRNVIPVWIASTKREYGAFTIRPKITKLLPNFLIPTPRLKIQNIKIKKLFEIPNLTYIKSRIKVREDITLPTNIKPGALVANNICNYFIDHKLKFYKDKRNDPNADYSSNLSPYLHFGQISSASIALAVKKKYSGTVGNEFLEELIIRRELADNFCFYTDNYDNSSCLPAWAFKTLKKHNKDKREYLYNYSEFENSQTHDPLWNAAQKSLVHNSFIHSYMRMYWAKKILEWTANIEQAFDIAIKLNDLYELDGRDPNGYAGIAWSLGGVHDRPWFERKIYGNIRYMNYNGAANKFDVKKYISNIQ